MAKIPMAWGIDAVRMPARRFVDVLVFQDARDLFLFLS